MLSAQKNREFVNSDYNSIKKVYSIWICVHVPKYAENSIAEFRIGQKNVVGYFPENRRYDLLSSIFICLSDEIVEQSPQYALHRLLEIFFSTNLSREQKAALLRDEYGIVFNRDMERCVDEMCNVSVGILQKGYNQGMEQGLEQGLEQGMEQGYKQGIEQGMGQLADAIVYARKNHISSYEELEEAGFSDKLAKMAISLL